jgi:hypothetical protein
MKLKRPAWPRCDSSESIAAERHDRSNANEKSTSRSVNNDDCRRIKAAGLHHDRSGPDRGRSELGLTVKIHLHADIEAELKVWVADRHQRMPPRRLTRVATNRTREGQGREGEVRKLRRSSLQDSCTVWPACPKISPRHKRALLV